MSRNTADQWITSNEPTDEPLVGRKLFDAPGQGNAIVELFGAAVAWIGANEKALDGAGDRDYERIYIYPNSHAVYYPGAKPIALKVLFRKSDGRLLGAQAVGEDGVDKRISTLAMAIQMGATCTTSRGPSSVTRQRSAAPRTGELRGDGRRRCGAIEPVLALLREVPDHSVLCTHGDVMEAVMGTRRGGRFAYRFGLLR